MLIFSIFLEPFSVHNREKCHSLFMLLPLLNAAARCPATTFVDERYNVSTNADTPWKSSSVL